MHTCKSCSRASVRERETAAGLQQSDIGSACEFDAEKCALSARVASFWSDIEELWFLAGKGR